MLSNFRDKSYILNKKIKIKIFQKQVSGEKRGCWIVAISISGLLRNNVSDENVAGGY
jgi:hypothetical protein